MFRLCSYVRHTRYEVDIKKVDFMGDETAHFGQTLDLVAGEMSFNMLTDSPFKLEATQERGRTTAFV